MISASGLYGLFRMDGGPVDLRDAAALGLPVASPPDAALATGVDAMAPRSIHRSDAGGHITIVVGDIEQPARMAARLALPGETASADLAWAALARFGAETPRELLGEWTLLHWAPGRLTLMASAARRDQLFFAVSGARCAVASDLSRLAQVSWIGRDLDEAGLLFALGRAQLRMRQGDTTILRGVRRLAPGGSVTISADGVREQRVEALTPQPRWRGSFRDAMAAAEALLLEILRERMARNPAPALLLSGGLDSSLLAWAMAESVAPGQTLRLITSAAPAGSGIPDETRFADQVAAALGLTCEHVAPLPEAEAYRPSVLMMQGAQGPVLSNRIALTQAFQATAQAGGATLLVNGMYGESNCTGRLPYAPLSRRMLHAVKRALGGGRMPPDEGAPYDAFHVRLSADRRARLPDAVRAALAAPPEPAPIQGPGDLWGISLAAPPALGHSNEFYPGALRMDFPYRDLRLLRLFAGFPMTYFAREGLDRAPARHLLKGRLPESIRRRNMGMPASPDHMARLQQQATAARARISEFRRAEIDDWLDLDWLDTALARVAERGPADVGDANEVQMTAINAEYLLWWRSGG